MGPVPTPDPILLLHGFAGTGRMWAPVAAALDHRRAVLAPDLPGHGTAPDGPVTFGACVEQVLGQAPARFVLGGYSLGGRVALHVALAAPERVTALVLLGATAGLKDPRDRAARRAADDALADDLERDGLEGFAERWTTQPLFAGDPPAARAAQREDISRQRPAALAAALRGIGTGQMAPLWDRLGELRMPVAVVAGERDAKFRAIAGELVAALAHGRLVVVPGAGHGLPREAPRAVAAVLDDLG